MMMIDTLVSPLLSDYLVLHWFCGQGDSACHTQEIARFFDPGAILRPCDAFGKGAQDYTVHGSELISYPRQLRIPQAKGSRNQASQVGFYLRMFSICLIAC